jgi:hypothetical protein
MKLWERACFVKLRKPRERCGGGVSKPGVQNKTNLTEIPKKTKKFHLTYQKKKKKDVFILELNDGQR